MMEVCITELANLYNHMEAHCDKTRLSMRCVLYSKKQ